MINEENEEMRNGLRLTCAQLHFSFSHSLFFLISQLLILSFSPFLSSCSPPDGTFRLKGKFKNFNQGELYVYSLEGKGKIDTVRLADGKFTYEMAIEDTALLSVVFPNFSEIPVIAAPATSVAMQGDASHLREVTVNGTDENEQLTQFRLQVNEQTPPEAVKSAAAFIKEHPTSPACTFILNKYFLLRADGDRNEAFKLLTAMSKADPDNQRLSQLKKQVGDMRLAKKGGKLPHFSAVTTTGQRVTEADLKGELNVINVWATWSYESQNAQRQLRKYQKKYGTKLGLLSICLDGNPADCEQTSKRDTAQWNTVCDGRMWDMPIVAQLGITAIPDNIITDRNGRIIDRGLSANDLARKIEEKLSK